MRKEKYLGHPVVDGGVGFFKPREQRTRTTQGEGNGQRANKETATQTIRDVAQRQSHAFDHSSIFLDTASAGIFHLGAALPKESQRRSLLQNAFQRTNSSTAME